MSVECHWGFPSGIPSLGLDPAQADGFGQLGQERPPDRIDRRAPLDATDGAAGGMVRISMTLSFGMAAAGRRERRPAAPRRR